MDDGARQSSGFGFYLCTHAFTREEVELLCYVRQLRSEHFSPIQFDRCKPRIYIHANSMERVRALVLPYFHDSMLYKLA
jgi:hypothetical protein